MNHCSCCNPACPVPSIEKQEIDGDINPVGHSAFIRYEDRNDGNPEFVQLLNIYPDYVYKYRSRRQLETKSRNYLNGNITITESGTYYLETVYSYDPNTCSFSSTKVSGGGMTYTYTEVDDDGNVVERITRDWAASTDEGREDEWLETRTHFDNGNTTVTTDYDSFSSVGDTGWPIESDRISFLETYDHTIRTKTEEYPDGTYFESDTLSGEWKEAEMETLLKQCLDGQPWSLHGFTAIHEVDYETDESSNPTIAVDEIRISKLRYRLVIPHDFSPPPPPSEQRWHGTWHRIQLKLTFTPGDPNNSEPVEMEREVIWTGPGQELETFDGWDELTPEQQQNRRDSWKTEWVEIGYPPGKGEVVVSLNRSQCYHGAPWVYH